VNDANSNGVDDGVEADLIAAAQALVVEAESKHQAAEDMIAQAIVDGVITPQEQAMIEVAGAEAESTYNAAQVAVNALPQDQTQQDLQSRLDVLGPIAVPNQQDLDLLGVEFLSETELSQTDLQILGLLEGNQVPTPEQAQANGQLVTVGANGLGNLDIVINQVSLLSIAQAVQIYVFDSEGNIVHRAMTSDNPLAADLLGIPLLGLTDGGALGTTVTGLEAGDYRVLVVNDESAISQLVGSLTLADLAQDGVVLGHDNQQLVLDAVGSALGSLGPVVVGLLTPLLGAVNGLGIDQILQPIVSILNSVGAVGLVDDVLDAVTEALVNNTLSLLEVTNITTVVTQFGFENDNLQGDVLLNDFMTNNTTVTAVNGQVVDSLSGRITVEGQYGVLTMNPNGSYSYTVNLLQGNPVGQSDEFAYTISNGITTSNATLTINIGDFVADSLTMELAEDTGVSDGITQNGQMNILGLEIGATWEYSTNGGMTWQQGFGDSFTVPEGTYAASTIQVRQTNWAGSVSSVASYASLVVDQTAPDLTVFGVFDNLGSSQGHIGNGGTTDDQTPELYGTAAPGATVSILLTKVVTSTDTPYTVSTEVTADADGNWNYTADSTLIPGQYTYTVSVADLAGNITTEEFNVSINAQNSDPFAVSADNSLLGIVGANVAGLIELDKQVFVAADPNNDLTKVFIELNSALSLGGEEFNYSETLKNLFGYTVEAKTSILQVLGILGRPATIEITKTGGGTLDNLQINEFLASVTMSGGLLGDALSLSLLSNLTITATDSRNISKSYTNTKLADVGLLGDLLKGDVNPVKEGTTAADNLDFSASTTNVHLYGLGGNDTLKGGNGNDIIRGGAGEDTINGGAGNDYINGGAGNDIITGGAGADTVVFDLLDNADATGGNGVDTWTDFSLLQGDIIDVSALLGPVRADDLADYVELTYDAASKTVAVSIDRDGVGSGTSANVLLLTNQQSAITLDDLLQNQQILF
ncbi:Ig-like domain-containing protein, partial [uncultured Acinetobacter sp.]|uniref:GA-like domain-containing protein n=1 Tax=uncultured Acinetobacter sp. TaxID=165433 RepID=UPI00262B2631